MAITTAMVKELREATGAGILDSKKALEANGGNFDKAVEFLREKGLAKAAKKASREANEGLVAVLVEGNTAGIVEVNCETDFVARTGDFQSFVNSIVRQVLDNPAQDSASALSAAPYADTGQSVAEAVQETISKLGENIVIRRAARYRQAGPGVIAGYVHMGGRIGVLVELGVEAEAAAGDALNDLAHNLTLQIAAANPRYLNRTDVPAETIAEERRIFMAQLAQEKKPENIMARIIEGKLNKLFKEICLLEQPFVKDDSVSIEKLLQKTGKTLGTTITINRFTRFELGS